MAEFMLLTKRVHTKNTESIDKQKFLKAVEGYILRLRREGKLVSAQPMETNGDLLSLNKKTWKISSIKSKDEIIGNYFHIRANDLEEAVSLAKMNPEFEFYPDTKIEIRPIRLKEESTGFVYPKNNLEIFEDVSLEDQTYVPF